MVPGHCSDQVQVAGGNGCPGCGPGVDGAAPESVFEFPPCIDARIFRPRAADELEDAFAYLSEQSGMTPEALINAKIVFETSRMDRTKRKDILLKSFAKIAPKLHDTVLFIGGG